MRRALAAAALAAAPACLSLPTFRGEDLVTYRDDGGGALVTGPRFSLHFASGTSFHFPDSLMLDGVELMGRAVATHDPDSSCDSESETGIKIAPTPRISPDGDAPVTQNQLTAVLGGPVVVQLQLDWGTQLGCMPPAAPSGTSTFTVFPDGRIVRHDRIKDPMRPSTTGGCVCSGAQDYGTFLVSSFWTFAQDRFGEGLYGLNDQGVFEKFYNPGPGSKSDIQYGTVCFDGTGSAYQVASTWSPVVFGSDRTSPFLFVTELLAGHRLDKPFGSSMLDLHGWDVHGALFLDHDGCTAAHRRLDEYVMPSPLLVNGQATTASPLDGMYGGDDGHGGLGLDLGADRATLSPAAGGTMPGSFAVRLRFRSSIEVPRATLSGATPTPGWYEPQRIDGRNWILWFRDPLKEGQTITIAPP